jgi:hypothetical protein
MGFRGYCDEPPIFNMLTQVSFLDRLPLDDRNQILVPAAVAPLGLILDHAKESPRSWLLLRCNRDRMGLARRGDALMPRFWLANQHVDVADADR